VAYILPDQHHCKACGQPLPRFTSTSAATPVPQAGWTCPPCGHSYAPWVPECHHCPEPPAFTAKGNTPGPIEAGP
jgi:hypothetical protein